MHHTNQYYFTKQKLQELLDTFSNYTPDSNKELSGFVFTPGFNKDQDEPVVYGFPLYSAIPKADTDGDILIQNLNLKLAGCPYPPKCY